MKSNTAFQMVTAHPNTKSTIPSITKVTTTPTKTMLMMIFFIVVAVLVVPADGRLVKRKCSPKIWSTLAASTTYISTPTPAASPELTTTSPPIKSEPTTITPESTATTPQPTTTQPTTTPTTPQPTTTPTTPQPTTAQPTTTPTTPQPTTTQPTTTPTTPQPTTTQPTTTPTTPQPTTTQPTTTPTTPQPTTTQPTTTQPTTTQPTTTQPTTTQPTTTQPTTTQPTTTQPTTTQPTTTQPTTTQPTTTSATTTQKPTTTQPTTTQPTTTQPTTTQPTTTQPTTTQPTTTQPTTTQPTTTQPTTTQPTTTQKPTTTQPTTTQATTTQPTTTQKPTTASATTAASNPLCLIPSTGASYFSAYNLITLGSLTSSSHVDNRTIVCGSLIPINSPNFALHVVSSKATSAIYTLEVNGQIVPGSSLNVNAGSFGVGIVPPHNIMKNNPVGYTLDGTNVNMNGGNDGATINVDGNLTAKCSAITTGILTLSTILAQLPTTNGNSASPSASQSNAFNFYVNVVDSNGVAVFNLDGNTVLNNQAIAQIEIIVASSVSSTFKLVVINLSGTSISFAHGNFVGWLTTTAGRSQTVWNLPQATSLNIYSDWMGALLAPYASVTNSANIDGATAVQSLTLNAELHDPPVIIPSCL